MTGSCDELTTNAVAVMSWPGRAGPPPSSTTGFPSSVRLCSGPGGVLNTSQPATASRTRPAPLAMATGLLSFTSDAIVVQDGHVRHGAGSAHVHVDPGTVPIVVVDVIRKASRRGEGKPEYRSRAAKRDTSSPVRAEVVPWHDSCLPVGIIQAAAIGVSLRVTRPMMLLMRAEQRRADHVIEGVLVVIVLRAGHRVVCLVPLPVTPYFQLSFRPLTLVRWNSEMRVRPSFSRLYLS